MPLSMRRLLLTVAVACLVPCAANAVSPDLHARIEAAYTADVSPAYLPDGIDAMSRLYRDALATKKLAPEDKVKAALLYAIALWEKGDAKEPLRLATDAVATLTAARKEDTALMGDTLKDLSVYQAGSGDVAGSLATKYRALALIRRHRGENSPQAGTALCSIAHAESVLGRLGDALRDYEAGLALMRPEVGPDGKHRDPNNFSAYLGNYAGLLRVAADPEKALIISREALAIAYQTPEGDRSVSWGMFNIASSLLDLGRFSEAEALYRQALDYSVKYGGKVSYETGSYTSSLGRVLVRQGKIEEAEAMLQTAVSIFEQVQTGSSPYLLGVSWDILGQLAYERGELDASEARLRTALEVLTKLGARSRPQTANARSNLALTLLTRNALPEALDQIDQALVYYRAEKPDYEKTRVSAETLRALILARMGDREKALTQAQETADAMEARLNSLTATAGDQADAALLYGRSFTRVADVAATANRPDLALRAAQLAAFTEVAATSRALAAKAAAEPETAALVEQLEGLRATRQRLDRERSFATGKSADEVSRLDGGVAAADAQLKKLDDALFARFPNYRALSQPRPLSVSEAQARLGDKVATVLPLSGDDGTLMLVVTRKGVSWHRSDLDRSAVTEAVRRVRLSVTDATRPFDSEAAQSLGGALFPTDALKAMEGIDELEVVGAGPVMSLPFGLLVTEPRRGWFGRNDAPWLIDRFAVSVRTSLAATQDGGRNLTGAFAGIGAPAGSPAETTAVMRSAAVWPLPQLPNAEAELKRMDVALGLPGSIILTGADATEARVRALPFKAYSVVAFATHGLVSGDLQSLREPALVMTAGGTDEDGLLTASEIAGFRLDADWVILSACNTGSGREAGAAGYSGLAKAFLQAGGRNVLVSLWPVRDDAAASISVDTVRDYARGRSEAAALRRATLKFMKSGNVAASHPAVWAPFSLVRP